MKRSLASWLRIDTLSYPVIGNESVIKEAAYEQEECQHRVRDFQLNHDDRRTNGLPVSHGLLRTEGKVQFNEGEMLRLEKQVLL